MGDACGVCLFYLISLETKKEKDEKIEKFFDNMQRLSDVDVSEKETKNR